MKDLADAMCPYCLKMPGYHPLRLVGFDKLGRAVLYSAQSQASEQWFNSQDVNAHLPTTFENAIRSMPRNADGIVWIADHSGFGYGSYVAAHGRTVSSMLADHYPGLFARIYLVNTPFLFSGVFSAMKPFMDVEISSRIFFTKSGDSFAALAAADHMPQARSVTPPFVCCVSDGRDALKEAVAPHFRCAMMLSIGFKCGSPASGLVFADLIALSS